MLNLHRPQVISEARGMAGTEVETCIEQRQYCKLPLISPGLAQLPTGFLVRRNYKWGDLYPREVS